MKKGFTLAEVLITLGIIGVVAAITIPGLITNYKAHKMRARFLKTYSVIQQAFKLMESDDVSLNPADYPSTPDTLFYKTFSKYLQAPLDCGNYFEGVKNAPCFNFKTSSYKNIIGTANFPSLELDAGELLLQDGTLLLFNFNGRVLHVFFDLNGYNGKPNRLGYDLFALEFREGEIAVSGEPNTTYQDMDKYCSVNSNNSYNGIGCAQKAKENSDYFKYILKNIK